MNSNTYIYKNQTLSQFSTKVCVEIATFYVAIYEFCDDKE
jgi:hypothetical protein